MWSPILSTLIGSAATLVGVWLSQRRERDREKVANAREDANRTAEHRREAYFEFMRMWQRLFDAAWRNQDQSGPEPDPDWIEPLFGPLMAVRMYGRGPVVAAAGQAYIELREFGHRGMDASPADVMMKSYLQAVREDLGVTGDLPDLGDDPQPVD